MAGCRYLINKVLSDSRWWRFKAKEHDEGEQALTEAEIQEQLSIETEKQNEDKTTSAKVEIQEADQRDSVKANKQIEDEQPSAEAEKHQEGEIFSTEVEKCDVGGQASTKSTTRYDYLKLDPGNIRLIHLLPSSGEDHLIECKMISTRIHRADIFGYDAYDALSYEWADARNLKEIILDGKIFHVRENLWNALRQLRGNNSRTLWIDAICIDQNNIFERNHQVSQMSEIYANAGKVIVCLGMESPSSWNAFSCIRKYSKAPFSWPAAIADNSWEALVELCDRSYWRRLWVIQEIVLARELEIRCGTNQLDWKELERVCWNLSNIPELDIDPPIFKKVRKNIAFRLVNIKKAREKSRVTMRELLETCEESLCVDPRDKIYGLVGLAHDTRGSLSIDYSKSLSDIYKDVVRFQWGIDFCSIVSFSQFLQWYLWHGNDNNQRDSTTSLRFQASKKAANHIISAPGILQGTVFSRGPIFGGTAETRNAWISTIASRFMYKGSERAGIQKQATQLIVSYQANEGTERNRLLYLNGFALNGLSKTEQPSELETMSDVPSSKETELYGSSTEPHPRLFALDNGKIGLGPNNIENGDCVCQFVNCDVAAILRPHGRGYKLIGRVLVAADEDFVSTYNSKYFRQQYDVPRHSSLSRYRDHITVFLDDISLQLLTR